MASDLLFVSLLDRSTGSFLLDDFTDTLLARALASLLARALSASALSASALSASALSASGNNDCLLVESSSWLEGRLPSPELSDRAIAV